MITIVFNRELVIIIVSICVLIFCHYQNIGYKKIPKDEEPEQKSSVIGFDMYVPEE
jgi:hypothetical protein